MGLTDIIVAQDHQKTISLCNHGEPNPHGSVILFGMGPHGKRMCNTFKLLKGGVSMSLAPKSKRAGIATNVTQTNSIILKAIREKYHNPDMIA